MLLTPGYLFILLLSIGALAVIGCVVLGVVCWRSGGGCGGSWRRGVEHVRNLIARPGTLRAQESDHSPNTHG